MSKRRITILATVTAAFAVLGASAAEAETIPERLMQDLEADFGFADFQAAGVVGNLARETGNFRYLQEIDPIVAGSQGGIGYSQWTASRRDAYEAWAGDADLTAYETNYGYLVHELSGRYSRVVDRILESRTAREAAEIFMRRYLVPHPSYRHLEERVAYAEAYLDGDFSGAGCQEHHEVEVSGRLMVVSMCPDPVPAVPDGQEDRHLGWALAAADVDDFQSLETDVQAVLADLAVAGAPYPPRHALPAEPSKGTSLGRPSSVAHITKVSASAEMTPKEKIFSLLEIDEGPALW